MKLKGQVINATDASASQRRSMLALMQTNYDNVCPEVFEADLQEKDWIIMLFDDRGQVQGFSTQMLLHLTFEGRATAALFSGDRT